MSKKKELSENFQDACLELQDIKHDTPGYGYTYLSLPALLRKVRQVLGKHGLGFRQYFTSEDQNCRTLLHTVVEGLGPEDTEVVSDSTFILPSYKELWEQESKTNKPNLQQAMGATITYFRRYCLATTVGLQPDPDTDAARPQPRQNYSQTQQRNNYGKTVTNKITRPVQQATRGLKDPGPQAPPY